MVEKQNYIKNLGITSLIKASLWLKVKGQNKICILLFIYKLCSSETIWKFFQIPICIINNNINCTFEIRLHYELPLISFYYKEIVSLLLWMALLGWIASIQVFYLLLFCIAKSISRNINDAPSVKINRLLVPEYVKVEIIWERDLAFKG